MRIRQRSLRRSVSLYVSIAVLMVATSACSVKATPTTCSGKTDPVVTSHAPFETLALLWIAEEQDFFAENCLDVTLRKYDTGAAALEAAVIGDADIAVGPSEFPLVKKALLNEKIRTFGSIDKIEFIHLVGRKDKGIRELSDLKGKRIGTTKGTIAEFFLGRFLELNGLKLQDVTVVDVKAPEDWVNAVVSGDVDAIATTQPSVNKIKERLGANGIAWPAQSNQPMYALLISRGEWLDEHPDLTSKFLKSLAQAEEYLVRHPEKAQAIVQKRLDLKPAYMKTVWRQNQYSLSLEEGLFVAMEDQARWMIDNDLTTGTEIPDLRSYISWESLKRVKPEVVDVIH